MDPQALVREFHRMFNGELPEVPTLRTPEVRALLLRLIEEEAGELAEALERADMIGVADALGDLVYVTYGAAVAFGLDLAPVLAEIHRSNLTKRGGPRRADGKILKGPQFRPPDIAAVLRHQMDARQRGGRPDAGTDPVSG